MTLSHDPRVLQQLINEALKKEEFRPDQPNKGDTHCNQALQYIAGGVGFWGFKGKVANEIVQMAEADPGFKIVGAALAQEAARSGRFVFAGTVGEVHGHVAVISPSQEEMPSSGKWQTKVPWIANVGKENKVMGANYAFSGPTPPKYYAIRGAKYYPCRRQWT